MAERPQDRPPEYYYELRDEETRVVEGRGWRWRLFAAVLVCVFGAGVYAVLGKDPVDGAFLAGVVVFITVAAEEIERFRARRRRGATSRR